MKAYIDCFIPWCEEKPGIVTENTLKEDRNVANVHHLTDSVGSTKTLKYIAETATAQYV
jgi:hypothetical protein